MKNLQNTAILVILLFMVGYQLYDRFSHKPEPIQEVERYIAESFVITLPEKMDFCGEDVPLKEIAVRERLDYDLHSNTYYHSNTIMVLKRANRWFPLMRKVLKKHGIPEDFLYLAVIESNLRNVVSPAGATGFWQFMKATAKERGLEVNKEVDERYHPMKSTEAACKYLKEGYKRFGNWTLVAASYNMGMTGVEKQLERQKAKTYYELSLNSETARYVYRILAVKEILSNPSKYQFDLPSSSLYYQPEMREIVVTKSIPDLATFAIENGTDYGTLKYHNEWLLTNKLTVGKGESYTIEIPVSQEKNEEEEKEEA